LKLIQLPQRYDHVLLFSNIVIPEYSKFSCLPVAHQQCKNKGVGRVSLTTEA